MAPVGSGGRSLQLGALIKNLAELNDFHGEDADIVLRCVSQAIMAVRPAILVKSALRVTAKSIAITDVRGCVRIFPLTRRVYIVGAGKAAAEMYRGAYDVLGTRIEEASITVPKGSTGKYIGPIQVTYASHPVPNRAGIQGTRRITDTLRKADAGDLIIVLISGGASALMPLPATGISLAVKQQVTKLLLSSGATIREMNVVRKHLSAIKGGQLVSYVRQNVPIISLIISDVVGNRLQDIASGPTEPDPSTFLDASKILKKYNIRLHAVKRHIQLGLDKKIPETPKPGDKAFSRVTNIIIGSNEIAVESAINFLKVSGIKKVHRFWITGEAAELGRSLAFKARTIASVQRQATAMVGGGETTVTLHANFGAAKGGRNQEAALAFCIRAGPLFKGISAFVGTDGKDGNSPAAGAVVSAKTLQEAEKNSVDLQAMLESHKSYDALSQTSSTVLTGLTGTNVNDIAIILLPSRPSRGRVDLKSKKITRIARCLN